MQIATIKFKEDENIGLIFSTQFKFYELFWSHLYALFIHADMAGSGDARFGDFRKFGYFLCEIAEVGPLGQNRKGE